MQFYKLGPDQSGFNFLELMVSIAIVTILIGLAIPSFASLIFKNQVSVQTNALFQSLYLARSYAITTQKKVHVCHMDDPISMTCSLDRDFNSNWSNGWLVFVDENNNNDFDEDDIFVNVKQTDQRVNVVFNQRGRLRFFPDGSSRSAGFYICDSEKQNYRHIFLLYSGRARVNGQLSDLQKTRCDNAQS